VAGPEGRARFTATLQLHGRTATGFEVPPAVVDALGTSRRPAVRVTVRGHTYRSSIARMGGVFLLGVSAENRAAAGLAAGDVVDVDVELDTAPREVDVPPALAAALAGDPVAAAAYDRLSYSARLRHALDVGGAKTDATRERRLAKVLADLHGTA
jgi:hypothetical protein